MIYVRLYINPDTKEIMFCETNSQPITTEPAVFKTYESEENGGGFKGELPYRLIQLQVESTDQAMQFINAGEFVDGGDFGDSIVRVKGDLSVAFCSKKAKKNKKRIHDISHLKITKCEVC